MASWFESKSRIKKRIYPELVEGNRSPAAMKRHGKLLEIAQLGNPVVRTKAKRVADVTTRQIQALIDDMIATVDKVEGVGIAAPQVNKPLRVCILASHPNPRYPHAPKMKPEAVINPQVLRFGEEKMKDWEGCLSIPGIRAFIPRYTSLTAEYTTRQGERVKKTFNGFVARIFQHEYDHLEGKIILDRIEGSKEIITEKEFQKRIKSRYDR